MKHSDHSGGTCKVQWNNAYHAMQIQQVYKALSSSSMQITAYLYKKPALQICVRCYLAYFLKRVRCYPSLWGVAINFVQHGLTNVHFVTQINTLLQRYFQNL